MAKPRTVKSEIMATICFPRRGSPSMKVIIEKKNTVNLWSKTENADLNWLRPIISRIDLPNGLRALEKIGPPGLEPG